jgi:hypothetical protein
MLRTILSSHIVMPQAISLHATNRAALNNGRRNYENIDWLSS